MQILLFRANRIMLHAQFIADLVEQFGRLNVWGFFDSIWGVTHKLTLLITMKYKLFYRFIHLKIALSGIV